MSLSLCKPVHCWRCPRGSLQVSQLVAVKGGVVWWLSCAEKGLIAELCWKGTGQRLILLGEDRSVII